MGNRVRTANELTAGSVEGLIAHRFKTSDGEMLILAGTVYGPGGYQSGRILLALNRSNVEALIEALRQAGYLPAEPAPDARLANQLDEESTNPPQRSYQDSED